MIIDEIDLKIINVLFNLKKGEEVDSRYGLIFKIFPEGKNANASLYSTRIKRKLKKLTEYGIIKIIENGNKRCWELQMQNVDFKKMKFKDGFKKVVCMKIQEEWCAFELSQ